MFWRAAVIFVIPLLAAIVVTLIFYLDPDKSVYVIFAIFALAVLSVMGVVYLRGPRKPRSTSNR
ncbi:MAG: hypothetical protein J5J00_07630 [Deltaproteobacteria bacterium]|nr:hypothetical protein [Deltaproteobacteria bacterium]